MAFLLRRLLSDGCSDDIYGPCPPSPFPTPYTTVQVSVPVGPSHRLQRFTVLALAVSSVLAAFFLLLTYYLLFLRFRANLRRRRNLAPAPASASSAGPPGDDPAGDEGGVHHIWYIRTVGLDESTIASIAVAVYKAGDGLVDCSDCSVCLGEFSDGELLRLLPKCSHAFHLPCIDTWLRAHVSCPLCRAPVVSAAPEGGDAPRVAGGDPDPPPHLPDPEILIGSLPDPGSSSSSAPGQPPEELWVAIDLGDAPPPHFRRSVSMDASALEADLAEMADVKARAHSQKDPGGWMERCQSTNGRRFFLPRFAMGRNTSILPL